MPYMAAGALKNRIHISNAGNFELNRELGQVHCFHPHDRWSFTGLRLAEDL